MTAYQSNIIIKTFFLIGAGVVTTRAHVHYVVTEQGIAYLFGKTLRQRAYELIKIAHPDHREALEKAAFERLKCMPAPWKNKQLKTPRPKTQPWIKKK